MAQGSNSRYQSLKRRVKRRREKNRRSWRNKARAALMVGGLSLSTWVMPIHAAPQGEQVVQGSASFSRSGDLTVITASNNSIIEYSNFDIAAPETVQFVQPNELSRVLNRITGDDPTHIDGTLLANGQVYIVNPAGVFFGQGAVVDVGAIYAAAGTISNEDFTNHVDHFTNLTGDVVNRGDIQARAVHLVGKHVANHGTILTDNGLITMTAGDDVLIAEQDGHMMVRVEGLAAQGALDSQTGVENTGVLDSGDGGVVLASGDMYSMAIKDTGEAYASYVQLDGGDVGTVHVAGTIDVSNDNGVGGDVEVLGDNVELHGATVDASGTAGGGTVHVGGELQGGGDTRTATTTTVDENTVINVDATDSGNGGEAIIWADGSTTFDGAISARGGAQSGDGGFVEVSGKEEFTIGSLLSIDLTAPAGQSGTLLLDPNDVSIQAGTQGGIGGSPVNSNTLGADDIATFLNNNGSLTIETSGNGGNGDITQNAGANIVWTSGNALTMNADRNVTLNGLVTNTTAAGGFNINADGTVNINNTIDLTGGGLFSVVADIVNFDADVDAAGIRVSGTSEVNIGDTTDVTLDINGVESFFESAAIEADSDSEIIDSVGTGFVTYRPLANTDSFDVGEFTVSENVTAEAIDAVQGTVSRLEIGHDPTQTGADGEQTGTITVSDGGGGLLFNTSLVFQADQADLNITEDIVLVFAQDESVTINGSPNSTFLEGGIFTDGGNVTIIGGFVVSGCGCGATIDTEFGDDSPAGAIDLSNANISSDNVDGIFTIDTTTGGAAQGGNVTLGEFSNDGGDFLTVINIDTDGTTSGAEIRITRDVMLDTGTALLAFFDIFGSPDVIIDPAVGSSVTIGLDSDNSQNDDTGDVNLSDSGDGTVSAAFDGVSLILDLDAGIGNDSGDVRLGRVEEDAGGSYLARFSATVNGNGEINIDADINTDDPTEAVANAGVQLVGNIEIDADVSITTSDSNHHAGEIDLSGAVLSAESANRTVILFTGTAGAGKNGGRVLLGLVNDQNGEFLQSLEIDTTDGVGGDGSTVQLANNVLVDGGEIRITGSGNTVNITNTLTIRSDNGGDILINDALSLSNGVTLTLETNNGGNIEVNGNIRGDGGGNEHLTVELGNDAGGANLTIGADGAGHEIGNAGADERFGEIIVSGTGAGNHATFHSAIHATALQINAGAGADVLALTNLNGTTTLDANDGLVIQSGFTMIRGDVVIANGGGGIDIDSTQITIVFSDLDLSGAPGKGVDINTAGALGNSLEGSILTDAAPVSITGPASLEGDFRIDTDGTADDTNDGGNGADVTFSLTIDANDGSDSLTIDTSDTGISGGINLNGDVGGTTRLSGVNLSGGTTSLGGDIFTENGDVTISGGLILAGGSRTIDTEGGDDGSAGSISLRDAIISANTPGSDLTLDIRQNIGSGDFGSVDLGTFGNAGGHFVNDLSVDSTLGTTNVTLHGDILLDNNGIDSGDFFFRTQTLIISNSVTVDTEQGDDGNGGIFSPQAFPFAISADAPGFTFSIVTATASGGGVGGTIDITNVNDTAGGSFLQSIVLDSRAATNGQISLGGGSAGTIRTDGGGVTIDGNVAILNSTTIDTEQSGANNGGDVNLATGAGSGTISGFGAGKGLTIDSSTISNNGNGGNVSLGVINNSSGGFLSLLSVDTTPGAGGTAGTTTLNGNVLLDNNGATGADFSIAGSGDVVIANSLTVDTEQDGTDNAGDVDFGSSSISGSAAGIDLTIDVTTTATDGNVTFGDLNNNGGGHINDFSVTADSGNITLRGGNIQLDDEGAGVDLASLTFGSTVILTQDTTIDTQTGAAQADGGPVDMRNATVTGDGVDNWDLTIDTSPANSGHNSNGGTIDMGTVDDSGGSFLNDLELRTAFDATSNNTPGNVTLHGSIFTDNRGADASNITFAGASVNGVEILISNTLTIDNEQGNDGNSEDIAFGRTSGGRARVSADAPGFTLTVSTATSAAGSLAGDIRIGNHIDDNGGTRSFLQGLILNSVGDFRHGTILLSNGVQANIFVDGGPITIDGGIQPVNTVTFDSEQGDDDPAGAISLAVNGGSVFLSSVAGSSKDVVIDASSAAGDGNVNLGLFDNNAELINGGSFVNDITVTTSGTTTLHRNITLETNGSDANDRGDLTINGGGQFLVNGDRRIDTDGTPDDTNDGGTAGNVTISGPIDADGAGSLVIDVADSGGSGVVTFSDDVGDITPLDSLSISAGTGSSIHDVHTTGNFTFSGGTLALNSTYTSDNGSIEFDAVNGLTLNDDVVVNAPNGNVTFARRVDGNAGTEDLTVTAGGTIAFTDGTDANIGHTTVLDVVTFNAGTSITTLGAVNTAGNLSFTAPTINIGDDVVSTGGSLLFTGNVVTNPDNGAGTEINFTTTQQVITFTGSVLPDAASTFHLLRVDANDAGGVAGIVTFGGVVGSAAQSYDSILVLDAVTVNIGGNMHASGNNTIDITGDVVLTNDVTLTDTGDTGVIFRNGSINSEAGENHTLTIDTTGGGADAGLTLDTVVISDGAGGTNPLGGFIVSVNGAITLADNISVTDTISLHAGADGVGNLTFNAGRTLAGDTINLRAGSGNGVDNTATVDVINNSPSLLGAAGGATSPTSFSLRQDASIADAVVPTTALFGNGISGMTYLLQSDAGSVTIDTANKVDGTALTLAADTEVRVNTNLGAGTPLVSLAVNAADIFVRDVTTTGSQTYNDTSGSTIHLNGTYTLNDAGNFLANGNVELDANTKIEWNNANGGNVTFTGTVDGAFLLDVEIDNGFTGEFQGVIGGTTPLAEFEGTGGTIIFRENVTTTGDQGITGQEIQLHGTRYESTVLGNVDFDDATTLFNDVTIETNDGRVRLENGINSDALGTPRNLTIVVAGANNDAEIGAAAGDVFPLGIVDISAPGQVFVDNVHTVGAQTYTAGNQTLLADSYQTGGGNFTINGASAIDDTTIDTDGGDVLFTGIVSGGTNDAIVIDATNGADGSVEFQADIGTNVNPIESTNFSGADITLQSVFTTTGQSYTETSGNTIHLNGTYQISGTGDFLATGNTELDGDTTVDVNNALAGNSATFTGTIDGGFQLIVAADNTIDFQGEIGGTTPLSGLNTSGGIVIFGADVTTTGQINMGGTDIQLHGSRYEVTGTGAIFINSPTRLFNDVTIVTNDGDVGFDDTLDSDNVATPRNLTVSAGGAGHSVDFSGDVGGTAPLGDLDVTADDDVDTDDTTTVGFQRYTSTNGDVSLRGAFQTNGGAFTVNGLTDIRTITIDTDGGNVLFTGAVAGLTTNDFVIDATNGADGTIEFQGDIGSDGARIGSIDFTGADVTLQSVFTTGNQSYTETSGNTLHLDGTYSINGANGSFLATGVVQIDGDTFINLVGNGTVTFTGSVNADAVANDRMFSVTADGGTITFGDEVGATTSLAAIVTNTTGNTFVGGDMTAHGQLPQCDTIEFFGPVVITDDVVLTDTGNVGVIFHGAVDGEAGDSFDLTINVLGGADATVDFQGPVGTGVADTGQIDSLTVDANGAVTINQDIQTNAQIDIHSGQDGVGDVTFTNSPDLSGGAILLRAGDGQGGNATTAQVDVINGGLTLRGTGGVGSPATFSLLQDAAIVDADIPTTALFNGGINGMAMTLQSFDGDLQIDTANKVDGTSLTLTALGTIRVTTNLGAGTALVDLAATAPDIHVLSVTSVGNQTYQPGEDTLHLNGTYAITGNGAFTAGDNVQLDGNVVIDVDAAANGGVTFGAGIESDDQLTPRSLTVTLDEGDVEIGGDTGATNPLSSISLTASDGSVDIQDVTTVGTQTYSASDDIAINSTLTSDSAAISFTGEVVLEDDVTIDTTNGTTLNGANVTFSTDVVSGLGGTFSLTIDAGPDGEIDAEGSLGTAANPLDTIDLTAGDITLSGSNSDKSQTYTDLSGQTITLDGTYQTNATGEGIDFDGNVDLDGDTTVLTNDGPVNFLGELNSDNHSSLTINTVDNTGAAIVITNSGDQTFGGAPGSFDFTGSTITFLGDAITEADAGDGSTGNQSYTGHVTFRVPVDSTALDNGDDDFMDVAFISTGGGSLTIDGNTTVELIEGQGDGIDDDFLIFFGGFGAQVTTGGGNVNLNGTLTFSGGLEFVGELTDLLLGSGMTVSSGGGDITITDDVETTQTPDSLTLGSLILDATTDGLFLEEDNDDLSDEPIGTVDVQGSVGAVGPMLFYLVVSDTFTNNGSITASATNIIAGDVTVNAPIDFPTFDGDPLSIGVSLLAGANIGDGTTGTMNINSNIDGEISLILAADALNINAGGSLAADSVDISQVEDQDLGAGVGDGETDIGLNNGAETLNLTDAELARITNTDEVLISGGSAGVNRINATDISAQSYDLFFLGDDRVSSIAGDFSSPAGFELGFDGPVQITGTTIDVGGGILSMNDSLDIGVGGDVDIVNVNDLFIFGPITGTGTLDITGTTGNDVFDLPASLTADISIDGGNPSVLPGDSLIVFISGLTNATLTIDGAEPAGNALLTADEMTTGSFFFENIEDVDMDTGTVDLVFLASADVADDDITISLNQAGDQFNINRNGTDFFAIDFDDVVNFTLTGTAQNESLIIDFVNGNPFPDGEIFVNGGGQNSGTGDSLVIAGDNTVFDSATFSFTAQDADGNDGNITLDDAGDLLDITFTGLEPIDSDILVDDLFFNLPDGIVNGDAALDDNAAAGRSELTGSTFEDTIFNNPNVSLSISLGEAGDTLDVDGLDAAFAAGLFVTGGAGNDTVNVNSGLSLQTINIDVDVIDFDFGAGTVATTGTQTYTADTVNIGGAFTTGASTFTINADDLIVVENTSIETGGGDVDLGDAVLSGDGDADTVSIDTTDDGGALGGGDVTLGGANDDGGGLFGGITISTDDANGTPGELLLDNADSGIMIFNLDGTFSFDGDSVVVIDTAIIDANADQAGNSGMVNLGDANLFGRGDGNPSQSLALLATSNDAAGGNISFGVVDDGTGANGDEYLVTFTVSTTGNTTNGTINLQDDILIQGASDNSVSLSGDVELQTDITIDTNQCVGATGGGVNLGGAIIDVAQDGHSLNIDTSGDAGDEDAGNIRIGDVMELENLTVDLRGSGAGLDGTLTLGNTSGTDTVINVDNFVDFTNAIFVEVADNTTINTSPAAQGEGNVSFDVDGAVSSASGSSLTVNTFDGTPSGGNDGDVQLPAFVGLPNTLGAFAVNTDTGTITTGNNGGGNSGITASGVALSGATNLTTDLVINGGDDPIQLNGTVDGQRDLTLNTTGATEIDALIGGTTPLATLTTDAGGETELGNDINTQGSPQVATITFNDNVVLTADVTLTDTGTTGITFAGTVNGAFDLVASAPNGAIDAQDQIGNATELTSVNFSSPTVSISDVETTGNQTYTATTLTINSTLNTNGGNVQINGDTELGDGTSLNTDGGNAIFTGDINGGQMLTIDAADGDIDVQGAIGNDTPLTGVDFEGNEVTVNDITTNNGPVTLRNASLLDADGIPDGLLNVNGNINTNGGNVTLGPDGGMDDIPTVASMVSNNDLTINTGGGDLFMELFSKLTVFGDITINTGAGKATLTELLAQDSINVTANAIELVRRAGSDVFNFLGQSRVDGGPVIAAGDVNTIDFSVVPTLIGAGQATSFATPNGNGISDTLDGFNQFAVGIIDNQFVGAADPVDNVVLASTAFPAVENDNTENAVTDAINGANPNDNGGTPGGGGGSGGDGSTGPSGNNASNILADIGGAGFTQTILDAIGQGESTEDNNVDLSSDSESSGSGEGSKDLNDLIGAIMANKALFWKQVYNPITGEFAAVSRVGDVRSELTDAYDNYQQSGGQQPLLQYIDSNEPGAAEWLDGLSSLYSDIQQMDLTQQQMQVVAESIFDLFKPDGMTSAAFLQLVQANAAP